MRSRRENGGFCPLLPLPLAAGFWMAVAALPASASVDAAAHFDSRCAACHSVGRGVVVGPDLKGVTGRHDARWLHAFIRSSQTVIRSGDASAVALF